MKPNLTRRELLAAAVGAGVAVSVCAAAGARWRVVAAPSETAPIAYQLDTWTGRAWILSPYGRKRLADQAADAGR